MYTLYTYHTQTTATATATATCYCYIYTVNRILAGARKQADGTWKDYIILDSSDFPTGQAFPRIDAFGTCSSSTQHNFRSLIMIADVLLVGVLCRSAVELLIALR
jgi:hypothetical protein